MYQVTVEASVEVDAGSREEAEAMALEIVRQAAFRMDWVVVNAFRKGDKDDI